MRFRDRTEAGERLAEALKGYAGTHPLILAIPRGGVILGRVLWERLGGELNLLLVRKIGHPSNPEFALAAVSEDGTVVFTDPSLKQAADPGYLEETKQRELERIRRYREAFGKGLPPPRAEGRIVIVVDDGIATGATMLAGLKALKTQKPKRLIAAAPVAPPESLEVLAGVADEVVILETPEPFYAVGQFYEHFEPVEDTQVLAALEDRNPPPSF